MPNREMNLFTSVQSRLVRPVRGEDPGPGWRRACIDSWKAAGFHIVSFNTSEQIEALRSVESIVEFRQMPSDRRAPSITEFFAAAASSKNRVVGILNSHCLIIPQKESSEPSFTRC